MEFDEKEMNAKLDKIESKFKEMKNIQDMMKQINQTKK